MTGLYLAACAFGVSCVFAAGLGLGVIFGREIERAKALHAAQDRRGGPWA